MAAPSVGRQSRQRQGVVSFRGKENGGLELCFKAAAGICILSAQKQPARQRFFSFPVGRGRLVCYVFRFLLSLLRCDTLSQRMQGIVAGM